MGEMIENVKKFGIPQGNDPKIAWNSKGVGHKRLDLLNRGCTVFFWKSPLGTITKICLAVWCGSGNLSGSSAVIPILG